MFKYYFVAFLAILFGSYRIYRDTIGLNRMMKVNGKVLSKSLETKYGSIRTGRKAYYSLAIATNSLDYKIGIPISEDNLDKEYYNSINNLFDTSDIYTFYLNPLVVRDENNVWCGIDQVDQDGKIIYQNRGDGGIIYGSLIIIVTLIAIIWIGIRFDPIKDSNFWINFRNGSLRQDL